MPRPTRHATDTELLDLVRQQLTDDPTISHVEMRHRVGGAQTLVSAAMRAAQVEAGLLELTEGQALDPRFANLIRRPEPPPPLDLRTAVPADLGQEVTQYLGNTQAVLDRTIERVRDAAVAAMDAERAEARRAIELADARAARAEAFVEGLRRELAEAAAEAERSRAEVAEEKTRQALALARLTRDLQDAQADHARAEQARDAAIEDRRTAVVALSDAHDHAGVLGRELAAVGARIQEMEHQLADLGARLTRADGDMAAARTAERDARAEAAAAQATAAAHQATIERLEAALAESRSRDVRRKARGREHRG